MNLQHLEQFRVAAELQHITAAANTLHVAQPALSKTIRALEEDLGTKLFTHAGRNISLNESGKILLKYVYKIEEELSNMQSEITENVQKQAKSITILLKDCPVLVVQLVQMFRSSHPEISVRLLTYNRQLNETCPSYDFELAASTKHHAGQCEVTLLKEEMVLAVPAGHPWAGQSLPLRGASQEKFLTLPSFYVQTKEFRDLCAKAGFFPKVVLESSDYYTLQRMIEAGVGIALVPQFSWGFHKNAAIGFAHITEPLCTNWITVSWESDDSLTEAGKRFRDFLLTKKESPSFRS